MHTARLAQLDCVPAVVLSVGGGKQEHSGRPKVKGRPPPAAPPAGRIGAFAHLPLLGLHSLILQLCVAAAATMMTRAPWIALLALLGLVALLAASATAAAASACGGGGGRRLFQRCGTPYETCCCQPTQGCEGSSHPWVYLRGAERRRVQRSTPASAALLPLFCSSPAFFGCCQANPGLFCHFFNFTPAGIPGSCPQPSLCLPAPSVSGAALLATLCYSTACSVLQLPPRLPTLQGCGVEGAACCPPSSDLGGAPFTCGAPGEGLECRGAALNSTYESFLLLQTGNDTALPPASFGTCVRAG